MAVLLARASARVNPSLTHSWCPFDVYIVKIGKSPFQRRRHSPDSASPVPGPRPPHLHRQGTTYPTTGSQFTTTYSNPQTFTYTPSTFTYAYDTMGRPNSLTAGYFALNGYLYPPYQNKWVQNVTYDYAGRQSSLQYGDGSYNYMTESKTWNGSGQLASVSWGGIGMTYSYSATQNNGQITQAVDTVSGETIVYQYDRLKRLVSASATPTANSPSAAWAENFQYDGCLISRNRSPISSDSDQRFQS